MRLTCVRGAIKILLTKFIVLIFMAFKDVHIYFYLGVYNKKNPPTKYAIIIA